MNIFIIILSILSLIAVLMAIVFEGMLKKDEPIKPSLNSFFVEFKKLSFFGWILIIISVLLGSGNGFISIKTINDSNLQYAEDTLKSNEIIGQLKTKRFIDSVRISNLEQILKDNGLKSDSIKLTLVDNALQTIEQQRKAIEKERENVFAHFQNEVKENLRKILVNYEEKHINGFADTNLFVATRLNNDYLKKYELLSNNKIIISFLMETSEKIDIVNNYANSLSEDSDKIGRRLNLRMFLGNVNSVHPDLLSIYKRIYTLKSYKEYEQMEFSNEETSISDKELEELIKVQSYFREKQIILK
jgi:hypothetical protein